MQIDKLMLMNLYEAYTIKDNKLELDTTALNVLCIGNSITYHPPLKGNIPGSDSLWRGNWGMCASMPDNDFVHQLERKFRRINERTLFTFKTIWEWENNLNYDKNVLLREACQHKDVIILKVGENVKYGSENLFSKAFDDLVKYCLIYTPNVIICGLYWNNPYKERALIRSACKHHLPYVPLCWILHSYKETVSPHVGDTVYDERLRPYPIATDFICTHPNDIGMAMIAEAIYNSVTFKQ